MRNAGLPGLELLALNLKREGKYIARTLGFKGCEFEVIPSPMTTAFESIYDACALQWEILRQDLKLLCPPGAVARPRRRRRKATTTTTIGGGDAGDEMEVEDEGGEDELTDRQKASLTLWPQFFGTHQRFFKSLYVAAKVPFLIEQAKAALEAGYAPIIGLQATGESHIRAARGQKGAATGAAPEDNDDGIEISQCRAIIERFLTAHVSDLLGDGARGIRERHLGIQIRQSAVICRIDIRAISFLTILTKKKCIYSLGQ